MGPCATPQLHGCDLEPAIPLDNSFKFNNKNIKETTNKNMTAHCSLPMLKRPSDEAGPSP